MALALLLGVSMSAAWQIPAASAQDERPPEFVVPTDDRVPEAAADPNSPAKQPRAAQQPPPEAPGALPTPQTDGIVLTTEIVGNTVYVGGKFTKARPAGVAPGGAGEVARHNVLAFDINTGELLPWAPAISGSEFTSGTNPGPLCDSVGPSRWVCDTVFRIKGSPDDSKVYVGGDFDKINGQWRSRIAGFDSASGELDPNFNPALNSRVRGISVTDSAVYIGGSFTSADGQPRGRLAAYGTNGELLPWAPEADGTVFAVLTDPATNRTVIGGAFGSVNGEPRRAVTGVDASSGANVPWEWVSPSPQDTVTDLVTDGAGTVYLGAYNFQGGDPRLEGRGAIDIATGAPKWMDGCYGDTQSVAVANGVVYSASHTHDCSAVNALPEQQPRTYQRLIAETADATGTADENVNHVRRGDPIPTVLQWFPNTNGGPADSPWSNGPWAVDTNGRYVVFGGEFTTVNGQPQQSLTRFETTSP